MAGSGTVHLRREDDILLNVENLVVEFSVDRKTLHAVSNVSFDIRKGETVGLVGESGCGKSTTGRAIVQMPRPTSGSIVFDGVDLSSLKGEELRQIRPRIQMIFQDPIASLNPRRKVADIVAEPLVAWGKKKGAERKEQVREMFDAVGLDYDSVGTWRPHQFSGGQCQRISIARALVLDPDLLICDEPVSALDVSVQAQILNLLHEMKERYGLTLLFISHDLAVVKNVSDRVVVIYLGKVCEVGPPQELYELPHHPYTRLLLSSVPVADPDVPAKGKAVAGGREIPSAINPPSGCRFRTRCPRALARCAQEEPEVRQVGDGHYVACHFPVDGPMDLTSAPAPAPAPAVGT
jgi:peptide/nickel transport system ATP-binding protein